MDTNTSWYDFQFALDSQTKELCKKIITRRLYSSQPFSIKQAHRMGKNLLKRAVIKEELVTLTGDVTKAVLLNQLIYWSERISDFDDFIREEQQRAEFTDEDVQIEFRNGWIYKSAEELSEETMLGLSKSSVGRHLDILIERGFIERRKNPKLKMDRTYQYRVRIFEIQMALLMLGYTLEGYRVPLDFIHEVSHKLRNESASSKIESRSSTMKPRSSSLESEATKVESPSFNPESPSSKIEHGSSTIEQQYQRLYTENTSENTSEIQQENTRVEEIYVSYDAINYGMHQKLKEKLSPSSYNTWFDSTTLLGIQNGIAHFTALTQFVAKYVKEHFEDMILSILQSQGHEVRSIVLTT